MAANQYGLSMIRFGGSVVDIGGITDWRLDNGIAEIVHSSDGEVDPRFAAAMTQAQKVRFRSTDIKAVLDFIGINGRLFAGDGTHTSCSFWFRRRAAGGLYSATANHAFVLSATSGFARPVSLRASHGQVAEIEVEIEPVSYQGAAPMSADEATAPAFAFGPTQIWTIGPAFLNNTVVGGVQDMTVDFGIETETLKGSGLSWPIQVSIKQRRPSLRLSTFNLDSVDDDAIALIGQIRTGAAKTTCMYLRKKAEGGANVANATAEHICFDVREGRMHMNSLGASHPNSALTEVVITPTHDGTNAIVVIDTASTIPTGE